MRQDDPERVVSQEVVKTESVELRSVGPLSIRMVITSEGFRYIQMLELWLFYDNRSLNLRDEDIEHNKS